MSITRPVAVLMSGAPGSGKSTLARLLSERFQLPLLDKDVLLGATLFSSGSDDLSGPPRGPTLWYRAVESLLDLGVSIIGDMTLYPGVSEPDVKSRLATRAHLICVHCRCAGSTERWKARLLGDRLRRNSVARLLPEVLELERSLSDPLDLGCPTLVVDTDDGHQPPVSVIEDELRAFVQTLSLQGPP